MLIPALIATSGLVSSLHTHAYTDHDHPEHHHGLAAHEHHAVAVHADDDGVAHIEGCDPSQHTISFAFVCAAPPQVHAGDAELNLPFVPSPSPLSGSAVEYMDVRVHGPPLRTQASPRAPPISLPA